MLPSTEDFSLRTLSEQHSAKAAYAEKQPMQIEKVSDHTNVDGFLPAVTVGWPA